MAHIQLLAEVSRRQNSLFSLEPYGQMDCYLKFMEFLVYQNKLPLVSWVFSGVTEMNKWRLRKVEEVHKEIITIGESVSLFMRLKSIKIALQLKTHVWKLLLLFLYYANMLR